MKTKLKSFFCSLCTTDVDNPVPSTIGSPDVPELEGMHISVDTDRNTLSNLKITSAAGPDNVHPRILREAAATLAPHLADLFRRSIDTGIIPTEWKLADVVPIYKKGSKYDLGNY